MWNGRPRKIGGWRSIEFNDDEQIEGVTRTIYSAMFGDIPPQILLGTNEKLYSIIGSYLRDITPAGVGTGPEDEFSSQGYGAGQYGAGIYGSALISSTGRTTPRIWIIDRFADEIVATPGNQGGIYRWDGDSTSPAVAVTNAPTAVNYIFVSDNILVTLGAGGVGNKIFASDQGDIEQWTASSTNQVFEDNIEGAGKLISHAPLVGSNLIFSNTQTYSFTKKENFVPDVGDPIWYIKLVDPNVGIISQLARITVNGTVFWMSNNNFHMYRGGSSSVVRGNVEIIPSNTTKSSTLLRYVFDDINRAQKSKIYAWHNEEFNEVWFHYPSADSNECNRIARVSLEDFSWTMDEMDRTAAEQGNFFLNVPHLANETIFYEHEVGNDADTEALDWYITTNKRKLSKDTINLEQVIPDSIQSGEVTLNVTSYHYPRSATPVDSKDYTIGETTEKVEMRVNGRYWQYTISGSELGQNFVMGQWEETLKLSSPR